MPVQQTIPNPFAESAEFSNYASEKGYETPQAILNTYAPFMGAVAKANFNPDALPMVASVLNPMVGHGNDNDPDTKSYLLNEEDSESQSFAAISSHRVNEELYEKGDSFIRHAIAIYPQWARKAGFKTDSDLQEEMKPKTHKLTKIRAEADFYRRIYGSGILVNFAQFGMPEEGIQVLNPNMLDFVGHDRYRIKSVMEFDCDNGFDEETRERDEEIADTFSDQILEKEEFFQFDNIWLPQHLKCRKNNNFGISTIQQLAQPLVDFLEAKISGKAVVRRNNILKHGIKDYNKWVKLGNVKKIEEAQATVLQTASIKHHVFHDVENTLDYASQQLGGLIDFMFLYRDLLPAISICPNGVFYSGAKSASGNVNSSKSDLEMWGVFLNLYVANEYTEVTQWLIRELLDLDEAYEEIPVEHTPIVTFRDKQNEIREYEAETKRITSMLKDAAITPRQAQYLAFPNLPTDEEIEAMDDEDQEI